MKNILKYFLFLCADLIVVGIVCGSVIRTIVYGIAGEENHHIYMIIRVTLIVTVFLVGCLFINNKTDDKRISFRNSKEILSVVNGEMSSRDIILHSKLFVSEIISFVAFMAILLVIMISSMYRLGGVLFVILDIVITLAVIGIYIFANYKATQNILEDVVDQKLKLGELDRNENKN